MKKLLLFVAPILMVLQTSAAVRPAHVTLANDLRLSEFLKLTYYDLYKLTGQKLTLKQKILFGFTKLAMKKAMKKNKDMTVKEFMVMKKKEPILGTIFLALGAIILVMFVLFMVLYKP